MFKISYFNLVSTIYDVFEKITKTRIFIVTPRETSN